jgi:hypothetical protein
LSRLRIQQRVRIYLGCEGQSEQSYAARLGQIADSAGLHLFIDNDVLQPGGGDPLALVELAIRRIAEKERKRGAFSLRAILLDRDKWGQTQDRDRQIAPLLAANGLSVIWQNPCHEGFLLRHFEGYETARPATSELAMQDLRRVWPEYYKAMPASQLAARIDKAAVRRASPAEQQFTSFLDQIGMTQKW